MALPGFTADSSLRPSVQTYRAHVYYGDSGVDLSPQQVADEDDGIDVADEELDEGVDDEGDGEYVDEL